jgi:flagellar biosynthesis/type III secretory pathway protein FliH
MASAAPVVGTVSSPSPPIASAAAIPPRGERPASTAPTAPPENLKPLLERILSELSAVKQHHTEILGEFQQLAVELAVTVAAKLTYETITDDSFPIERLVQDMLTEFDTTEVLTVRLNPHDRELLQKRIDEGQFEGNRESLQFLPDATLPRGGCQVDSTSYGLVTDLATRVDILRHRLMDGLENARTERRKTPREGAHVQRLSDGREAP